MSRWYSTTASALSASVQTAMTIQAVAGHPSAAWVGLADNLTAYDVEQLADEIEREMIEAVPAAAHVFLDPTRARPPAPADHADA